MPVRLRGLAARAALLAGLAVSSVALAEAPLPDLHWRLLGPFRAGWSTMATGIPDQPDTFFFGAAGGGVWKTVNAGRTWQPIFDGTGPSSSVGALAVAARDPQVIYVGTGQPEPRYDIAAGDGVYRSGDGGKTWTHVGLEATKHIGAILVDAQDANTLLVGAMGHLFGPNAERGVFRSTDGGQHWSQTLKIDDNTGVVDLAVDPAQPKRVYAAAWQWRNYPWLSYFTPIEGPGSAVYVSDDAGLSWRKLGGDGWPSGPLGRIGLAATHLPNGQTRLYASISASKGGDTSGLFRSDDGGAHWQRVNATAPNTSWYNSRITIVPDHVDRVYTFGQSLHRSDDAGQHFTITKGAPGGDDYHQMWINPKHPERMVMTSDQGTVVSVDGGQSWSEWYNQPTGQFYHLAADNRFPYWVYAGQQDNGTVGIASRSDYGSLTFRDWHPVGGDERDDDLPDPNDPDIVYSSGLGGRVSKWDARTGQSRNITPWPVSSYGQRQTDVKYRYTWITPLAITKQALYLGSQVLWRTTDRGEHWQIISPDLTGKDERLASTARRESARTAKDGRAGVASQGEVAPGSASAHTAETNPCGGDVAVTVAKPCGYGVIFNIAPSPLSERMIWVGTDNGLVQLTRDGGQHWSNVTPPGLPVWARVNTVDPSALDAGTAYVAVDNHRQDDFSPYAWRTHDYGRTWQPISAGLPRGQFVAVVRADPVRRGLLYAGTDAGVHVSFDDGEHWQPLQLNLPQAWVRDLLVHGHDLIAATQGRALWVLDDLSPLRQHAGEDRSTRLIRPAPAFRLHANNNKDTPLPVETAVGENPPEGAVIDYVLGPEVQGVVALEIRDAAGRLVRRDASDDAPVDARARAYFADVWLKARPPLPATPGPHRVTWNLRHPRPEAIGYEYSIAAVPGRDTPTAPAGPYALPGTYDVVLKANGREWHAPLVVKPDPRLRVTTAELRRALQFSQAAGTALEQAWIANGEIEGLRKQLEALPDTADAASRSAAQALLAKTAPLVEASPAGMDFGSISEAIAGIAADMESADAAPTQGQREAYEDYAARLQRALKTWQTLRADELPKLNLALRSAGRVAIRLPARAEFETEDAGGGVDLP